VGDKLAPAMEPYLDAPRIPELPERIRVVNVGLPMFADAVREQGAEVADVDWQIPAGGREDLVAALIRLRGARTARIDAANAEVVRRLDEGAPLLRRVGTAVDEIPAMGPRTLLHPGPPIGWEDGCDPLRRSARAAVVAEGWADDPEEAGRKIADGEVELEAASEHATALPMASVLGPSAPVLVVEDPRHGRRAFSGLNQGPGAAPWFGVETPEAVARLVFLREAVGPVLNEAIEQGGPVDVFALVSQGLQMGDDAHMRIQATTNLFLRNLLPSLTGSSHPARVDVARFLSSNHLFFLNVAMAAAKAVADGASGVAASSIVTGMVRNGTTFGIRLSGTGDRWFVAEAPPVGDALYHPGFGPEDAAPDIGDSAVLELLGLGGAAAAASPAVAAFVGGSIMDAVATTETVERICVGRSRRFRLPYLDLRGSPMGVDVRNVVQTQVTPAITTGVLHRTAGLGQIGAGVARAPLAVFEQALLALDGSLR
jgi:hypothetical protein